MIENQISSRKRCFLTTTPTTTTTTTTKTHNIYNHCRLCFWAISTTMPTLLPLTHLISRNNVGVISSLRAVPYFRFIFFSHALCCCPRTFLRVSLSLFICFFFVTDRKLFKSVGRSVQPSVRVSISKSLIEDSRPYDLMIWWFVQWVEGKKKKTQSLAKLISLAYRWSTNTINNRKQNNHKTSPSGQRCVLYLSLCRKDSTIFACCSFSHQYLF